jgi:CheY-like chemotaxis protein
MAVAWVLVVDDDPVVVARIRAVLGAAGYGVVDARSGRLGLERIAIAPPDLVITSILMPDGDGIELICAVKRERPDLPVVAISDRRLLRGLDVLQLARQLGADVILEKPVDDEVLTGTVADLIPARPAP